MNPSSSRRRLCQFIPILAAVALFCLFTALLFVRCRRNTGGQYVYPLDDSYIHMSIARNLAQHGVWGVTPYAFGASSSSPLWTMILALGFKVLGVRELLPLVLCGILSIALLVAIDIMARREGVPVWMNAVLLPAVALCAPLPLLTLLGMEHVCQILIDVVFVYVAARSAEKKGPLGFPTLAVLGILSALTPIARYEGMFLVASAAFFLLLRRRWGAAGIVLLAGACSVGLFAAFFIHHGGFWLPNSVLIKGEKPRWLSAPVTIVRRLELVPSVFVLLTTAAAALAFTSPPEEHARPGSGVGRTMLFISALTALIHLEVAKTGGLLRYEAYLVVLLMVSLTIAFAQDRFGLRLWATPDAWGRIAAFAVVLMILATPVADRLFEARKTTPKASRNIYQQQVQMSRFLKKYYNNDVVELHDIGACTFFTNIHLLDWVGLDGAEVARKKLHHQWTPDAVAEMTRRKHVALVITYDYGVAPKEWIKVGTWTIPDNHVCAMDTVSFFAVKPSDVQPLVAHLKEFNPELPPAVTTWTADKSETRNPKSEID